jgi:predicted phage terminase large subunit-like protein
MPPKIDKKALTKELCKRSFLSFVKIAWKEAFPDGEFKEAMHAVQLIRHLEALETKELTKDLNVNIPPGHGKSVIAHVFFPAWVWIRRPSACFIYTSYNAAALEELSVRRGDLIASNWFQSNWGDTCSPKEGNWNKFTIKNNTGGIVWAVPIKGAITGKHVDYVFIDDPIKPKDVDAKELQTVENVYSKTIPTRVAKKKGRIVCIMQRLREGDLSDFLVRTSDFESLIFPAEYVPGKHTSNILGVYDTRTEANEPLWPEYYPEEELKRQKARLGPVDYSAQFQQSPIPAEGNLFKIDWICRYDHLPEKGNMIITVDTAFGLSGTGDYTVAQVWMKSGADFYLVDQVRKKLDFPQAVDALLKLHHKWPKALPIYVEMNSNGPAIVDTLKKLGVSGIKGEKTPHTNKYSRANSVTPLWEAGNVWLPKQEQAPWVIDFIEEITAFDNGVHDDQVDAMSMALNKLHKRNIAAMADTLSKWIRR